MFCGFEERDVQSYCVEATTIVNLNKSIRNKIKNKNKHSSFNY